MSCKPRMWIGIDPGKSGAIAAIGEDGDALWVKHTGTESDLYEFLMDLRAEYNLQFAMLEKVHSMPKQGVKSTFAFGQSYGFLRGLLTAMKVPWETVTPQKWQTSMGCRTGGNKTVSKAAAQRLFPDLTIIHANADALLIAEHCRRIYLQRSGERV